MKKLGILFMMFVLCLSAFASAKSEGAVTEVKEVTFWIQLYGDYENENGIIKKLVEKFEAEKPGIKVKYEINNWSQAREKITTMHLGGEAPDVQDMFWAYTHSDIGNGKYGTMPIEKYLATYIPDLEDRYFASSLQDVKYKGHTYGVPWRIDVRPLVYRKDFAKEAGLDPKTLVTWDDLVTWGKRLTKRDAAGKVTQWGAAIRSPDPREFYNFIWQAGGSFLNEDYTKATIDTPEGREALQYLVDLVWKHKVATVDSVLDPSYDAYAEFAAGRTAIFPVTSSMRTFIEKNAPQLRDKMEIREPLKYRTQESFQGAGYFGVNYQSKNPEAAMEWVAFLASTESMRALAVGLGRISPCKPALEDPFFTEDWWFKGHTKALPFGRTTQHPNKAWSAITVNKPGGPIYDMMVGAIGGEVPVAKATATAQKAMEELIASYK